MPKISAVMALYNTPDNFLKATVESVLNQTFEDFEFIIVDDASTIEYKEFFESFNDERIKYFKLDKNSGPGHARNVGIKKACGKYVAIVDSDDVYKPQRFQLQAEFLDNNHDISLIGGAFRFSNKKVVSKVIEKDDEIKAFILFNSPFANPLVMLRKDIFIEKNLLYPENKNFGEDYELWIDAMLSGIKMANLKDVLMIYTRRKNQLSKEKKENQIEILKDLYKKVFSGLKLEVSKEEIDLHYDIYCENFDSLNDCVVANWFDKIIEQNKHTDIFNEKILIEKKNQIIKKINNCKNRLFKLKISEFNLCIYKPFKVSFERR